MMNTVQHTALKAMITAAQISLGTAYTITDFGAYQNAPVIPAIVIMPCSNVAYSLNSIQKGQTSVIIYENYDDSLSIYENVNAIELATQNFIAGLSLLPMIDGYLVSPTFTFSGSEIDNERRSTTGTRLRAGNFEVSWGLSD